MSRARTLVGRTTALLLISSGAVVAGATTATAVDGTISGTISFGNRTTSGEVDLYKWNSTTSVFEEVNDVDITKAGAKSFSFTAAPGYYTAAFDSWSHNTVWHGGLWYQPTGLNQPGVFQVTDGAAVRADIAVPSFQTVSGALSGAAGVESEGYVDLLRWDDRTRTFRYFDFVAPRWNGSYSLDFVPAGAYTLELTRQLANGSWQSKWLGGNTVRPTTPSGAGVFSVGSADLVKNFNFDGLTAAPVATTAPAVPATAKVGTALTATGGSWTETPDYTFQWLRNGVAIPGANTTTYVPGIADAGQKLAFAVTAAQAGTATGSARSGDAVVAKLVSSTQAKAKRKKVERGDKVKLTVTVTVPGVASPTGLVKVFEGKDKVAKGTLGTTDGGTLKLKVKDLALGKHKLKVEYLGNTVTDGSRDKTKVKVVR